MEEKGNGLDRDRLNSSEGQPSDVETDDSHLAPLAEVKKQQTVDDFVRQALERLSFHKKILAALEKTMDLAKDLLEIPSHYFSDMTGGAESITQKLQGLGALQAICNEANVALIRPLIVPTDYIDFERDDNLVAFERSTLLRCRLKASTDKTAKGDSSGYPLLKLVNTRRDQAWNCQTNANCLTARDQHSDYNGVNEVGRKYYQASISAIIQGVLTRAPDYANFKKRVDYALAIALRHQKKSEDAEGAVEASETHISAAPYQCKDLSAYTALAILQYMTELTALQQSCLGLVKLDCDTLDAIVNKILPGLSSVDSSLSVDTREIKEALAAIALWWEKSSFIPLWIMSPAASKPLNGYTLCLMSELEDGELENAKEKRIYLSEEKGSYCVRDPAGIVQTATFPENLREHFEKCESKLDDDIFKRILSVVTSGRGHTSLDHNEILKKGPEDLVEYINGVFNQTHARSWIIPEIMSMYPPYRSEKPGKVLTFAHKFLHTTEMLLADVDALYQLTAGNKKEEKTPGGFASTYGVLRSEYRRKLGGTLHQGSGGVREKKHDQSHKLLRGNSKHDFFAAGVQRTNPISPRSTDHNPGTSTQTEQTGSKSPSLSSRKSANTTRVLPVVSESPRTTASNTGSPRPPSSGPRSPRHSPRTATSVSSSPRLTEVESVSGASELINAKEGTVDLTTKNAGSKAGIEPQMRSSPPRQSDRGSVKAGKGSVRTELLKGRASLTSSSNPFDSSDTSFDAFVSPESLLTSAVPMSK
jgi:hypothetical protein